MRRESTLKRSLNEVTAAYGVLRDRSACGGGITVAAVGVSVLLLFAGLGLLCVVGCGDDDGGSPANRAPVITGMSADPDSVLTGGDSEIRCVAQDADGDDLTYVWDALFGTVTGSAANVVWTAPDSAGDYSVSVTVEDGRGGSAFDSVAVVVMEASEEVDQSNLPEWGGGWTNVNPAGEDEAGMWQTFMPERPNLTAVEIAIMTANPGRGDDVLTVEIAEDGDVLASAERSAEEGFEGLVRFEFPEAVILVPEDTYELRVRDTGKTVFGWKYGTNTYERGMRYLRGEEKPGTDWFFRTYSEAGLRTHR